MINSEEIDIYLDEIRQIPYNSKFEQIDGFGDAVQFIQSSINSDFKFDLDTVMLQAVELAYNYISGTRHSNDIGFVAKGRGNLRIFIDDLEMAILLKYLPRRLSNFLKGFQAEYLVNKALLTVGNIKVLTGRELDLKIKTVFKLDGDFSADKHHHIDLALEYKHKLFLIHVYQCNSQYAISKKIKNYCSKKGLHILNNRYGITYQSLADLTHENILQQLEEITKQDMRKLQIAENGTVKYIDFD